MDANLGGADLQNANLQNANLRNANLWNANLLGTGCIAAQVGCYWVVCTPDTMQIGCMSRTHGEWSALTKGLADETDGGRGGKIWPYRPLLLEMMKRCRVLGWPEPQNEEGT